MRTEIVYAVPKRLHRGIRKRLLLLAGMIADEIGSVKIMLCTSIAGLRGLVATGPVGSMQPEAEQCGSCDSCNAAQVQPRCLKRHYCALELHHRA
jgi:hypothetical protein